MPARTSPRAIVSAAPPTGVRSTHVPGAPSPVEDHSSAVMQT